MFANDFTNTIHRAWWARQDRLVVQIPLYVHRDSGGGVVAARAILLHRLERDPVQVAAQLAHERSRITPPILCHIFWRVSGSRGAIGRKAKTCAGFLRLG